MTVCCVIDEIKSLDLTQDNINVFFLIKQNNNELFERLRNLANYDTKLVCEITKDCLVHHKDVIPRELLKGAISDDLLPDFSFEKEKIEIPKQTITSSPPKSKIIPLNESKISNITLKLPDLLSLLDEFREKVKWFNYDDVYPILDKIENANITFEILKSSKITTQLKDLKKEYLLPKGVVEKIDNIIHKWKEQFQPQIEEKRKGILIYIIKQKKLNYKRYSHKLLYQKILQKK